MTTTNITQAHTIMKNNTDIEQLTRNTHSPKGEYAANEDNYLKIKARLNDQPNTATVLSSRNMLWKKIAVAASIIIVSCISYAMTKTYIIDMPRHKTLTYHEATISDIIHDIENEYHVKINIKDKEKLNYKITAEFTTDEDIEGIIDAISAASGTTLTIE